MTQSFCTFQKWKKFLTEVYRVSPEKESGSKTDYFPYISDGSDKIWAGQLCGGQGELEA